MEFVEVPSASKQIRRLSWKLQKTFVTPLKALDPFVDAIVSVGKPQSSCITLDQVVFEPKEWMGVLRNYSLTPEYRSGLAVSCRQEGEIRELLLAAFAGWVDFSYVPKPTPFVIYADHDEYTTFYANTKSNLNSIAAAIQALGIREAEYQRRF